jgi:uncharacterized RDD family membrane protein YckC
MEMTWYYAEDGRQIGPIEEPALDDLARAGVVRDDTLVWREGMAGWQPHGAVRGVRPPPPMPSMPMAPVPNAAPMAAAVPMAAVPMAAGTAFCSECGRPYPPNQLVMIGNATVCAQCKPLYMQRVREGGQAIGVRRYAGFWIRFVALFIDGVIVTIASMIVNVPLVMLMGLGSAGALSRLNSGSAAGLGMFMGLYGIVTLLNLAIGITYYVYFVSARGATPGKSALGLRIIRADGGPISAGLAFGRYLCYIVDAMILYIGFIMAGFDPEKRALHDRICDTRVIHSR